MKSLITAALLLLAISGSVAKVEAQYSGENLFGDFGLRAGTQLPPGKYVGVIGYYYHSDQIKGPDGKKLTLSGSLRGYALLPFFQIVTKKKFLGANYSALIAVPFFNTMTEFPRLDVKHRGSPGLSDIYIQPLNLGWHAQRADYFAGYAFSAPTGRYVPNGTDNRGLGMWSHEFSAGTTYYFDKEKEISAAVAGFYEIHTKKRDSNIRVGNTLTLEGGVGKTLHSGAGYGLAGYANWKVTRDKGSLAAFILREKKDRVFALGPEVDLIQGALSIRYFFEFGGRTTLQGQSLVVTFGVPIPLPKH